MQSRSSLLEIVLLEFRQVVGELFANLSSDFSGVMRELGWDYPVDKIPALTELMQQGEQLEPLVVALEEASSDTERLVALAALASQTASVLAEIQRIGNSFRDISLDPGSSLNLDDLRAELPKQLCDSLVVEYLRDYHRALYLFLTGVGVLEERAVGESSDILHPRLAHTERVIHARQLASFLRDPGEHFGRLMGWGSEQLHANDLVDVLESALTEIGIPAGQYPPHIRIAAALLGIPEPTAAEVGRELRVTVAEVPDASTGYFDAVLSIYPLPKDDGALPGIAIIPSISGEYTNSIILGGNLELRIAGDVTAGVAIELRPKAAAKVHTGIFGQGGGLDGVLSVEAIPVRGGGPVALLETAGLGSLTFNSVSNVLGASADGGGAVEAYWDVKLVGGTLQIGCGRGDAFLRRIFPAALESDFDLRVGLSSERGIYFDGSGSLEVVIPVHTSIGPVTVEDIRIGLRIDDDGRLQASSAISAKGALGPISAYVKDIGIGLPVSLIDGGGNAGPFQVERPEFRAPTGAGLSINTGIVVGAGVLDIDPDNARYAGILGLKAAEIGLTAIGLITTRMPDGSDGFSLLVSIGVVFAPPIVEPNTGLTIMGVGGLIGVNRDMSTEALQAGLRAKALDSILFPDPATVVENASKIISDLRTVFPPAEGRFVIGPMIKAGWGGGMISTEIGVFISLPMPVSVALLGQVQGFFPQPGQDAVVELNMDILGILDIGQKMLSFQASLRDSNILRAYTLYGDTAFLMSWGDSPQFALAIGGFHPRFDPPPPPRIFSGLKRLGVSMSAGRDFSIVCEGYQALTPNTLQFGALIDLFARKAGATFRGHANFDALIYFSPFSLEAAIAARVSVEYEGVDLANVRLAFVLTGPTPWRARGKAKFEVLHFDVEKSFSFSWGPEKRLELPAIDPWVEVKKALGPSEAWGSALPAGVEPLESLVSDVAVSSNNLLAHPSGTVRVRQRVAPLKKQLATVGNAPVRDHDWVEIDRVELGHLNDSNQFVAYSEVSVSPEDTFESFARAQFESLSDSQKLSAPSFEPMRGGVAARIGGIWTDESLEGRALEFESILLTAEPIDLSDELEVRPPSRRWPQRARGSVAFRGKGEFLCAGARRARQAATGAALGRQAGAKSRCVEVLEEVFRIVNAEDLMTAGGIEQPDGGCSRSEADRILASLDPARRASVQVVSAWEAGSRP